MRLQQDVWWLSISVPFYFHSYTFPAKHLSVVWNFVVRLLRWVKLRMYIFESGSRLSFIKKIPFPLLRMSNFLSSNNYWHPRSQKVTIDSKALLRPRKICAFRDSIGRSVLESSAVWVDVIISPFGTRMGSGLTVTFLLSHGESRVR